MPGSVQVNEPERVSGALSEMELVTPLSFNTSLFAIVPFPWIVTLPDIVVAPALIVPRVSITVAPVMRDTPLMVPVVITGIESNLLVRVAVPASVTITPVLGNVAFEVMPVPPRAVGSIPVTAVGWPRSTAENAGAPPPAGITRL